MENDKVALFLGAGFSREAGMPVMAELGEVSEKQLHGIAPFDGLLHNKEKRAYPILKKHGERFEALREHVRNAMRSKGPFNADDLEELYTLAEMMVECGNDDLNMDIQDLENKVRTSQQISPKALVKSIKIWFWQIFRRVPLHDPNKWKVQPGPYETFVEFLDHLGVERISVLTTNYDMIFEYLCHKRGIKISYCIDQGQFDLKDVCNPDGPAVGSIIEDTPMSRSISVLKLHGSVNFFEEENENPVKKKLYIIPYVGGKVGNSEIRSPLPSIAALDSCYKLTNEGLVPSIIPPTFAKIERRPWLEAVWKNAVGCLSSANKWIFIGYRFPQSDGHMKSLIRLALLGRRNLPKVFVIAPKKDEASIAENYRQVFGSNFKFYPYKFSEFVNNGYFKDIIT